MQFITNHGDFVTVETAGRQVSAAWMIASLGSPVLRPVPYGVIVQTERFEFRVFFN